MVDFISVLPENCAGAFANLDIPFGYEYLEHVTMRRVNFGPQEAGFPICADCGKAPDRIAGRSSKLRLNYRTTEEIRNWAVALLEGREIDDLDEGVDDHRGFLSLLHGRPSEVRRFPTLQEELDFVVARVRGASSTVRS